MGTFGSTRSEQEKNLRSEGYRSLTDGQLDKCDYMERKLRDATGSSNNCISQADLDGFSGIDIGVCEGWNRKSQKFMNNFDEIKWD
jgi:hypothetical protein